MGPKRGRRSRARLAKRRRLWIAYVEVRSALAHMRAGDRLDALGHERQRSAFERLWSHMAVVAVDTVALTRAAQLSERHVLRAYDAMHLASALEVAGAAPLTFACWDRDLLDAAEREGLAALR